MPGGGHTPVVVMVTGIPELQAAAVQWRPSSSRPPQPAHGGLSTVCRLLTSRKVSALSLLPKRDCGQQKEQGLGPGHHGSEFPLSFLISNSERILV